MLALCEGVQYSESSSRDVYLKIALHDNERWVKKTPSLCLGEGMGQQHFRRVELVIACVQAGEVAESWESAPIPKSWALRKGKLTGTAPEL